MRYMPLDWISIFTQFDYLGVFLISLIGSLSVIIPVPYTIAYYLLGATLDPVLLALVGGFGSALGEISGYAVGYLGHALIDEEQKRKMSYLLKIFDRYGPLLVFLFALTPLPDGLLFIALGISRYSFVNVFIPCLLGKIAMAYIIAYSGKVSYGFIKVIFGGSGFIATIVTLILLAIIIAAMFKIDWELVFKRYLEK
jgi:membrane protein YqaA with SNARE-associated domain